MHPISSYEDALNYIYTYINPARKGRPKYKLANGELGRMRDLVARLDHPQRKYPVLLIAGTKGKGSTSAMCESMLRAAGYKTGLYTSPRLHTFRERIRINNKMISAADVVSVVQMLYPYFEATEDIISFERWTAMAFVAFAQANIDIAVVEVGIGGRLDATNVTDPVVSVITSISYDHTHLLGNTLTSIAREKAGIIRPDGLVVSAPQYPEAMMVIEDICRQRNARLVVAGERKPWRIGRADLKKQIIYINGQVYTLPLLGHYQALNAATALAAIEALQSRTDLEVSLEAARKGLATVTWPGRLEILSQSPFVIVDSAMNGDSARELCRALTDYFFGRNIILIFGASSDHDYNAMLAELLPISRHIIVTQSDSLKAARPEQLVAAAQALGYDAASSPTVSQALADALPLADERDVICVTGSLFCAADARLAWAKHAGLPLPETDPV
jgi:dihydrofolate synthase/folylpolyglutamate synthase